MKLSKIEKLCCFYASDWHFAVMILPYIDRMIKEGNNICLLIEEDLMEKIKILTSKLELKNKDKILELVEGAKVAEDGKTIFIISGDEKHIKEKNASIKRFYKNKYVSIKIINCYEVNDNNNLKNIVKINGYKKALNTSGEIDIS